MNKLFYIIIAASLLATYDSTTYSTTSVVTLVGAKIKAQSQEPTNQKYKRKDCPVCKGKGWYMSGDGIKKIDCTYCEPEQTKSADQPKCKTTISKG